MAGVDRSTSHSNSASGIAARHNPPMITPDREPQERVVDENEAVSSGPQQTNSRHPQGPRRSARTETLFGIPQPPLNVNPNYDDDYEKRFPPDPIYEEASSPNARVYRVYMEESAKYDAYMTDEAREGLDVLLVFAGLFSAVLTTFVAQTSQSLQPDRATESTFLLREIAALQRAQMNGTSVDSIPSTPADFVPSSIDVWVNGLWFTSLTLSLASALFAVLIRQWIRHYMSFISGTPRERSLIRQYRFMGLQKWHVPTLIGILPVLMHLSLAIFFAGLTLFLVSLRRSIASTVGSASALVFLAYIGTAVWPLFHEQCPYHSPLTDILHGLLVRMYILRDRPKEATMDDVVPAFEWLLSMSSNPSVHRVVVQAVGGILHKPSSIDKLVNILDREKYNMSFLYAWDDMFIGSIRRSAKGACILPERVDLLERLFRSALHIRQPMSVLLILQYNSDVRKAIQSFPAPTLQWESAATALLWRYGICKDAGDFEDIVLAKKACGVVHRLISDPREKETRLPVIVWEGLLAAASSCPSVVLPLSDPFVNKMITDELTRRVCFRRRPSDMYRNKYPISFKDALGASEHFVWSLLSPFDKYEGNALDSTTVQRLLSLVNAIISRGLCEVSHAILFAACKELICELKAWSVTLKDQEAICVVADALLQAWTASQDAFGPEAVLLPSLLFLHCWKPHITSWSRRQVILLALIHTNMFQTLREFENTESQLWSASAFLIVSLVRTSFESRTGPGAQPEDSRWLEYLCLPANRAAIVPMITFQGSKTSLSVCATQVRNDLLLFFSRRPLDCKMLQECKTSLEQWSLWQFASWKRPPFKVNEEEAKKVIDELISDQYPQPANLSTYLLRRSGKSPDPEARS